MKLRLEKETHYPNQAQMRENTPRSNLAEIIAQQQDLCSPKE